jgi:predicted nucleic acid-binding Zn ribbon protein
MGKRDSPDPVPIKASLDRVARRLGGPDSGALTGVFARWADLVGDQLAAHSKPLSLSRGVLVVAVTDPAWATQFTYLEGDLLARFREALGEGVVDRVEVRQRRG